MDIFSDNNIIAIIEKFALALIVSFGALLVLHCIANFFLWFGRAVIKHKYPIRAMGKCVRIDDRTISTMGKLETYIIPVFEARVDGKKVVYSAYTSAIPCIIQKGDELEILINPKKKEFIYSDEGLREYRKLKKQRNKYWWLLDLSFVIVLTAFVSELLIYS